MKLGGNNKQRVYKIFLYVVRICLGCIFIYSSIPKLLQPYDFLSSVYGYELVGAKLGMFVTMVFPWVELFAGICLVGGIFVSGALLASSGMGAMFSFVIGWALYMNLNISCGCFGSSSSELIDYWTLIRALVILAAGLSAYILMLLFRRGKSIPERG
ncbi:MAG: hypothetical protein JRC60_07845 [Deltaproteobacteria bacterium]|nr:hypothetical protein [Deltaproteobacteria bacterium]